jgi:hypothetical protein
MSEPRALVEHFIRHEFGRQCTTVEGVPEEFTVYAIVHNLVRKVMMGAAARQGVGVERVSFIDALRSLREMKTDDVPRW